MSSTVYTIGHSTRPLEEFIGLLRQHGVALLVDVRRFPHSPHNPQYEQEALRGALEEAGIGYRHMPELGGRRRPLPDSPNRGWQNDGFRGYADYMQTPEFAAGLAELVGLAQRQVVCVMCAEAVPWRCHRRMIADALLVAGFEVLHVIDERSVRRHVLTPWAKVAEAGNVFYPGAAGEVGRNGEDVV